MDIFVQPPAVEDDRASGEDDADSNLEAPLNIDTLPGSVLRAGSGATTKFKSKAKQQNQSDSDELSDDKGPLAALLDGGDSSSDDQAAVRKKRRLQQGPGDWEEGDLEIPVLGMEPDPSLGEGGPEPALVGAAFGPDAQTPLDIFELFFDDELVNMIVFETERYAGDVKGDHEIHTRPDELRAFHALLICSGYNQIPRWRQWWA